MLVNPGRIGRIGLSELLRPVAVVAPVTAYATGAPLKSSRKLATLPNKHWETDVWATTTLPDNRIAAGVDDSFGNPGGDGTTRSTEVAVFDGYGINAGFTSLNRMTQFGQQGTQGDGRNWKTCDLIVVGGILYQTVARQTPAPNSSPYIQTSQDAQLLSYSTDYATITPQPAAVAGTFTTPTYAGNTFAAPYFVHYGKNYSAAGPHGSSTYLYLVSTTGSNGSTWNNSDGIIIGRRPIGALSSLSNSDTQWYTGPLPTTDAQASSYIANSAYWSSSVASATQVFTQTKSVGMNPIKYDASTGRYLYIQWFYTKIANSTAASYADAFSATTWRFYDVGSPIGPFTKIGADYIPSGPFYNPIPLSASFEADGRNFLVLASGDFTGSPGTAGSSYTCWYFPVSLAKATETAVAPATVITPTGSASGTAGIAQTITVTGNGRLTSPLAVVATDGTTNYNVTLPASDTPSATFSYTPASSGTKTISISNAGGLDSGANLSITVAAGAATALTLSGPNTATAGTASSNFTVAANGSLSSAVTVTPTDSGAGGTFTPSTVTLNSGTTSATFIYTASAAGTVNVGVTNNGGLTNPSAVTVTVSAAGGYTNYISNPVGESVGSAPWEQNKNASSTLTVTPAYATSPRGANKAARVQVTQGGTNPYAALQQQITIPSSGSVQTVNISAWIASNGTPGQKALINIQRNGGSYDSFGYYEFTTEASGTRWNTDISIPAGVTGLYVSFGLNESLVGYPTDQSAALDFLIDQFQVTLGSGLKAFVIGSGGGSVPANTAAPAISGGRIPGSTYSTTNGTWSNGPTGYAYQWLRNGVAISGATAQTYTGQAADNGTTITCAVTASNGSGAGTAATSSNSISAVAATAQDVVVSFGQSNTIGARNNINELPASYYTTDNNVFIYRSSDQTLPVMVPGPMEAQPFSVDASYPNTVGWRGEFTKHYRIDNASTKKLYHFVYAIGGSRFSDTSTTYGRTANWTYTLTDGAYAGMKTDWNRFVAQLALLGYSPNIVLVMTDLGYSSGRGSGNESGSTTEANAYQAAMTSLIGQMRTDIIGNTKLVIARAMLSVASVSGFENLGIIRTAQQNIAAADTAKIDLMNTDGFAAESVDFIHFTAPSHAMQGEQLYYHKAGLWYPQKDIAEMGATIYPVMEIRGGDLRNTYTTTVSSLWDCIKGGQSGAAPFAQATSSLQPTLTTTTLGNGYTARYCTFDGVDDYMLRTTPLLASRAGYGFYTAVSIPQGSAAATFFTESASTTINPLVCPSRTDGAGNHQFLARNDAGTLAGPGTLGASGYNGTMNFLATSDNPTSAYSGRVNATASGSTSYTRGTTTTDQMAIGAFVYGQNGGGGSALQFTNAKMGIVWVTNTVPTTAYLNQAQTFTQRRFGTA